MALVISFAANYNLDSNSANYGKIVLTDTSNYVANGILVADTLGYFNITGPLGAIHSGSYSSPDITAGSTYTIPIPTDANGKFLEGTYTVQYFSRVTFPFPTTDYSSVLQPFNFFEQAPQTGSIAKEYECVCLTISARDITTYGNPTTINRVFTLIPPQGLNPQPADYITSSASLAYTFQYTGPYILTLDTVSTYVSGWFTVTVRTLAREELQVVCNINFCTLVACYNGFWQSVLTEANSYGGIMNIPNERLNKYLLILGAYVGFKENFLCGNPTQTQAYYNYLSQQLNCDCGCSHTTEPTLINPFCGSSAGNTNTVIVAAGSGINVTSNTVGSTTTYTVAIQQSILDNIATLLAETIAVTCNTTFNSAVTYPAPINIVNTSTGFDWAFDVHLNNEEAYTRVGTGSAGINQFGVTTAFTITGVAPSSSDTLPKFNRDIRGYVNLRGTISCNHAYFGSGQMFVPLFKLPVGYRPNTNRYIKVTVINGAILTMTGDPFAQLYVTSTGDVFLYTNKVAIFPLDISFDGVQFKAEQ